MQSFSGIQKILIAVFVVALAGGAYFFYSSRAGTEIALTLTTNPDLERGLVGHWTFDGQDMDWSSTTAEVRDKSGNNISGDVQGGMTTRSNRQGVLGQGIHLANTAEKINLGSPSVVDDLEAQGGGGLSVSAWVYPTALEGDNIGIIMSKTGASGLWVLRFTNSTYRRLIFEKDYDGADLYVRSEDHAFTFNEWNSIMVTWDGSGTATNVHMYVNGAEVTYGAQTNGTGNKVSDNTRDLFIGCDGIQGCTQGTFDDARVYNRVLSADEVKRLYQLGATTKVAQTLTTNPDLERGLVGHWTFDGMDVDWSSTTAEVRDRSGNGNHADADTVSVASVVGGPIGQALAFLSPFDGPDNNVGDSDACVADTTGNDFDFADGEKFTLAGWLKPLRTDLNEHYINKSLTWYEGYGLSFTLGVLHFYVGNGVDDMVFDMQHTLTDPVGRWHHFTAVWGETYTELYVDGALVDSQYSGLEEATSLATDGDFCIGSRHHGYRPAYGYMDDIRVYNRALSAEEAKRLYELGATTKVAQTITTNPDLERGLVGHWTFDGQDVDWSSTTAEIKDRSGQGNHGNTTASMVPQSVRPGPLGQAMSFDGVGDTVEAGSLDITTAITLAGWVRPNVLSGGQAIVSTGGTSFSLNLNGSEIELYYGGGGGGPEITTGLGLQPGNWYHVVGIKDEVTDGVQIYVDGQQRFSGTDTTDIVDSTSGSFLGSYKDWNSYLSGTIDDVRIYNRALSADEIKRLYELGM